MQHMPEYHCRKNIFCVCFVLVLEYYGRTGWIDEALKLEIVVAMVGYDCNEMIIDF